MSADMRPVKQLRKYYGSLLNIFLSPHLFRKYNCALRVNHAAQWYVINKKIARDCR